MDCGKTQKVKKMQWWTMTATQRCLSLFGPIWVQQSPWSLVRSRSRWTKIDPDQMDGKFLRCNFKTKYPQKLLDHRCYRIQILRIIRLEQTGMRVLNNLYFLKVLEWNINKQIIIFVRWKVHGSTTKDYLQLYSISTIVF